MRRYRVAAWIVGVGLLALVLGMVLKYGYDRPTLVGVVAPVHGFLYMGYLVLTADLAVRARWTMQRALGVALAGTIPFLSFVVERAVTRPLRAPAADGQESPASR